MAKSWADFVKNEKNQSEIGKSALFDRYLSQKIAPGATTAPCARKDLVKVAPAPTVTSSPMMQSSMVAPAPIWQRAPIEVPPVIFASGAMTQSAIT